MVYKKRKMAKKIIKKTKKDNKDKTLAIVGLILNIIILPGLGTVINKKYNSGIIQMVLFLAGLILCFTIIGIFVGIPLMLASWIWGLIDGIKLVTEE